MAEEQPKGEVSSGAGGPSTLEPTDDFARLYLEQSRDLVFLVDRDFRYVQVNHAHTLAHKRPVEEIVGRTVSEMMGPEVFALQLEPHYRACLEGEPQELADWFDLAGPGNRFFQVKLEPYRDSDGAVVGLLGVVRDSTEQQQAAEDLEASRERLAVAISAARTGTWEWNIVANTLAWSDQVLEIFGVTREEFAGTYEAFLELLHPEDTDPVTRAVQEALDDPEKGDRYAIEYRSRSPDGRTRWQLAKGQVFRDGSGAPLRMLGVTTDITERKGLEAQLRQAQKLDALGRLAGGIAHDFNNIVASILGAAELSSLEPDLSATQKENLTYVMEGASRAAKLTARLLAFARQKSPARRPVQLNQIVGEMKELFRWTLGSDIEVIEELDPKVAHVNADPDQIEQVLLNLVVNARDAMGGRGTLRIRTQLEQVGEDASFSSGPLPPGDYVAVAVSDTGSGIAEDDLEHIFEPFFSTKDQQGSTGMGLAITYGIVLSHDGGIRVTSAPGEATTLTVLLPVTEPPARGPDELLDDAEVVGGTESLLLIEDEPDVLRVVIGQLQGLGYRVVSCSSGGEALRAFGEGQAFDMVLTDVFLAGMDGFQIAEALVERRKDLRVLFMSGRARMLPPGAERRDWRLLTKPFTRATLAKAVREALDRR